MTQAASERGGDWQELQQRNSTLQRELDRREQQIKMARLEKDDMQKQLDNLESSCNYFQTKYKTVAGELKAVKRESESAADGASKARNQSAETLRECDILRGTVAAYKQQLNEEKSKRKDHAALLGMVQESMNKLAGL